MTHPLPSTIRGVIEDELVIKKSRFLTRIEHVETVTEAEAVIAARRKEFWNARHHCVALVVGQNADQQRSSDDGEPSGTAGIPMLEVLRNRHITDVVAIVTRYFGGIMLGAGGLVRAYSTAVSSTLDGTALVRRELVSEVTVEVSHAEAGRTEFFLRDWVGGHGSSFEEPSYTSYVTFSLGIPPVQLNTFNADLAAFSAGALTATVGGQRVVDLF